MAIIYKWDSPRKANEVLTTILYMTDKKSRLNPITCTHKQLNINEVSFTLWYNPFWGRRASFYPPSLKGVIIDTTIGCTISAETKSIIAYISNIVTIGMMILFYIMGFAAMFADFHLSFIPSILFFLLAIVVTWAFINTYRKYGKLKVYFEIMNAAVGVDYQVISF